jgi:hypothetical protein
MRKFVLDDADKSPDYSLAARTARYVHIPVTRGCKIDDTRQR